MVEVPKIFPEQASSAIASYDFQSVADGTGYSFFYPCAFKLSGSTTYGMANSTDIVSGETVKKVVGAAGTSDVNYDSTFNLPKNVKGKVLLCFSLGTAVGNGGVGAIGMAVMKLYKGTGGVYTQIGLTKTSNSSGGSASDTTIPVLMDFDLSNQVYHFKKGDILRLNAYLSAVGGSTSTSGYSQDPSATVDTTSGSELQCILAGFTTRMTLAVPFVVDL